MARTIEIPPFTAGLYARGREVTDLETAKEAVEALYPGQGAAVEPDDPDNGEGGLWLVDFPSDVTVEILFSGGWYEHQVDDFRVEVELP